jgi:acyl carrier protein
MTQTIEEFLKKIAETLEVPAISESDNVTTLPQWDSLAALSLIAMFDANYGVNLVTAEIQQTRTAGELWKLVRSRSR